MSIPFDHYVCPRCGGSKKFSKYSHISNGVCFKCSGAGYILTEKGQRQKDTYELLSKVTWKDLKMDDRVIYYVDGKRYVGFFLRAESDIKTRELKIVFKTANGNRHFRIPLNNADTYIIELGFTTDSPEWNIIMNA